MAPPHQHRLKDHDEPPEPHICRPPQHFHDGLNPIHEPNGPVIAAEVSQPTVRPTCCHQPVHSNQDTEFFDINDHSEVDKDNNNNNDDDKTGGVEQPIPQACAPQGQALPSSMATVNSIEPSWSGGKGRKSNTWDVNHFFVKTPEGSTCQVCKLVSLSMHLFINLMSNYCRDLKESDPSNFHNEQCEYKPTTSNWSLCGHIECLHIVEYLESALANDWQIFLTKVNVVQKLGYKTPALLEALKKPGVTLFNLPPPPRRAGNSQEGSWPDGNPQENELPPFSTAVFH